MKNYKKIGIIKSKGRLINEPNSPYRSPFQRDRDRIIHSTAFRRLKHKTQVFVNTEGDHYRTRITHSIEVAQIARTISRYLNLNDDLTETLSLAHDLGHTPFGHAGEEALNECMNDHGGFDHNLQTLRIVMFIENKYVKFKGLNLTVETLDGLFTMGYIFPAVAGTIAMLIMAFHRYDSIFYGAIFSVLRSERKS